MVFDVAADKMVMVGGSIITIKAGKFESTDDATCEAILKATGIKEVKQAKKQKKAN